MASANPGASLMKAAAIPAPGRGNAAAKPCPHRELE